MKVIKEDIENLERYIGNKRVDIHAELPLIMADAYSASKNTQDEIEKELKDSKKEPEIEKKTNKVLGAEKQPVPKMPEEAKVALEESLFEDVFYPHRYADVLTDMIDDGQFDYQDKLEALLKDIIYLVDDNELSRYLKKKGIYSESLKEDYSDVRHYSDMLFDMIEDGMVDATHIAQDLIYWCSEDDIERYMQVNDLIWEDKEDDDEEIEEELLKERTEKDKYYDAMDFPKGPERKRVAAERRKEFLATHDLRDRSKEWKAAKGKDDPEEEKDLFTRVQDELFPYNMNVVKLFTKLPDVPARKRYKDGDVGVDYDGNILVYSEDENGFNFARQVAEVYGLETRGPIKSGDNYKFTIIMPQE